MPLFDFFVEHEVRVLEGEPREPGRYRVTARLPAPGAVMAGLFVLLATAWYYLFVAGGTWLLSGVLSWSMLAPSAVLACNSTYRLTLKTRERWMDKLGWDEPAGRYDSRTRVFAILIGAAAGAIAGYLMDVLGPPLKIPMYPLVLITAVGAWEAFQNGRNLGGGVDQVENMELQIDERWERLGP